MKRSLTTVSKKSSLTRAKNLADKYFSLYVRQRDADENGMVKCCTCGKRGHWKDFDCGHFMSRRYEATRFEEKNTGVQCTGCNIFSQGKQFEFGKYLDGRYGDGTAEKMLLMSKMTVKRGELGLRWIIEEYKKKIESL